MKRITAIFFILLANIALLAHAVIPHHHHDKVAVAIINIFEGHQSHNHENDEHDHSHHHQTAEHHSHHHSHNGDAEECLISDTVYIPSKIQEDLANADWLDGQDFDIELIWIADNISIAPCFEVLSLKPKPYTARIHLDCLTRSIGLRAPPVC